ncbi:glycosyltransferase family 2 protein [Vibrio salinus]|uniref:glycosyltransferase family 2 protein n=1 Tax=Vibrio salinus TaxID=2899784 RepID=UPI001E60FA30|nr:glycosyltransferase family 2 protein [Vibrio salinus]MCE0494139.1 glycosyltransferase family 2 protein [Vibrio salinus]
MTVDNLSSLKIAVLLPCYNEEGAIANTITGFQTVLPQSVIYVYDNNSTDNTILEARHAGAIVRKEPNQGKGEVVRRMFADVEADIYIMADGDATYDPQAAPLLIQTLIDNQLDMVVGTRSVSQKAYPTGHILGNIAFSNLINKFFNASLQDVFSGYRVMSRRFVKTIPVLSSGFEIETELTVHALHHKFPMLEVPTTYHARPEGTTSKLNTFSDGFRILSFIFFLIRDVKPLLFFASASFVLSMISLSLGIPVIIEFIETGLVARFPTAILASSIGIIAILSLFTGLILDNVSRGRVETKLLHYLNRH